MTNIEKAELAHFKMQDIIDTQIVTLRGWVGDNQHMYHSGFSTRTAYEMYNHCKVNNTLADCYIDCYAEVNTGSSAIANHLN